jgi:hypothetical protein
MSVITITIGNFKEGVSFGGIGAMPMPQNYFKKIDEKFGGSRN